MLVMHQTQKEGRIEWVGWMDEGWIKRGLMHLATAKPEKSPATDILT